MDITNLIITFVVSLVLCALLMPIFIPISRKLKFGQSIRVEGPKSHLVKQGTPTMGGIVFVISTFITMLIINHQFLFSTNGLVITMAFLGYFVIGLIDDLLIVVKKKNDGLSIKAKLILQAIVIVLIFVINPSLITSDKMSTLSIFGFNVNLHYLYFIFAVFMFLAYTNAINFTDGLDGLASISVAISLVFIGIIAYAKNAQVELVYIGALIGALIGFFIYNKKPAKIFMGDTGSLALGGLYAIMAMLLKIELISVVIGLVFVLEAVSVVIQIVYYKKTKKRFFRMAPFHHHFEMGKLKEQGTVLLFYVFSLLFGLLGMVLYFV